MDEILKLIPQRPPFLFVDKILEKNEERIKVEKVLTGNEDFFKGHFPENPIMPGVLLCEATFQAGALLMSSGSNDKLAVVSRIKMAKFKEIVRPPATLIIDVTLQDKMGTAYFLKGEISVNGKSVMANEFACSLIEDKR